MTSACIKWAKEHLDEFNATLVRQLSSVQRGTTVWKKCMDIVDEHANMLTEVGVDFKDLIGKGLEAVVADAGGGGGGGGSDNTGAEESEAPAAKD